MMEVVAEHHRVCPNRGSPKAVYLQSCLLTSGLSSSDPRSRAGGHQIRRTFDPYLAAGHVLAPGSSGELPVMQF